jgi:enoyl-CoA hydratase/carnithine racemase
MNYQTIEVRVAVGVATIWLNRPEIRDAINETLIAELTHAAQGYRLSLKGAILKGYWRRPKRAE